MTGTASHPVQPEQERGLGSASCQLQPVHPPPAALASKASRASRFSYTGVLGSPSHPN